MIDVGSNLSSWIFADNSTNLISGTPQQPGSNYHESLKVVAVDEINQNATALFNFEVKRNDPPSFNGVTSTNFYWYEGLLWEIDFSQWALDEAGDTIKYNGTNSNPPMSWMGFDEATGIFTWTPAVADIYEGYNLVVFLNDDYSATNGNNSLTFKIFIRANQPPSLNSLYSGIPPLTLISEVTKNFSFSEDLFLDPEGETITYSFTSNVSVSSWLTFDSINRMFNANPPSSIVGDKFLITILADDINPNSDSGSTDFEIEISINYPPELDQGLPAPINSSVYYEFWYIVPLDAFQDPENDSYSISVELDPPDFAISYNETDRSVRGTLTDNTKFGIHTVIFNVEDINGQSDSFNMTIEIYQNLSPIINSAAGDPSWVISHYTLDHSVLKSSYSEPEGEDIVYTFTVDDASKGSWVSMTQNDTHLHFTGTPDNLQVGSFVASILLTDPHSDTGTTEDNMTFWVTQNQAPYLSGSPTSPPNVVAGMQWSYIFDLSWVEDIESESLTHSCGTSPDDGWVTCTNNYTHVVFEGVPDSNSFAKEYELSIISKDPHPDVADYTHNVNFTVSSNQPPTLGAVSDQTTMSPHGLEWSYGASIVSDPESLPVQGYIKFNGSETIPSWLVYDVSDFSFNILSTSNSIAGVHTITLGIDDGFNTALETDFTLTIQQNLGPVRKTGLDNHAIVNYQLLSITFLGVDDLFEDPDGETMTGSIRQVDGSAIPSFLTFTSNILSGTPLEEHVGTWAFEYVATDAGGNEGIIPFKITVKRKIYWLTI